MKSCTWRDCACTLAAAVGLSLSAALPVESVTVTFLEGTSGYAGTQDTYVNSSSPAVSFGASATVLVDNNGPIQGLIRFDGIIGNGAGQIPPGSVINSATITFDVTDNASSSAIVSIHRMLAAWTEASTWNSLAGGVSTNDVEAQAAADGFVADPNSLGPEIVGGLAPSVQAWAGGATNHGWVIVSDQNNDWAFRSSENGTAALRPLLTVDYTAPAAGSFAGRVFEDADFGGVASAWDGGAADVALAGVDVELYTSGGLYVADTTTDASGLYAFLGVADGDYKVRVRSGTIGDSNTPPAGGFNAACGVTDPATGAACVLPELVWANGAALYGGQNPTLDDTATANDAGPGDTWIPVTAAGALVTGLDFGFAYNAIVHAGDSGQGSLRQFLANANAIGAAGGTTASSSEFRMQVPANQSSGGDSWWRITVASALPLLGDDGTTLDGSTQRANSGTDSNSRGPELEIRGNGLAAAGIEVSASSDHTVKELVVNGFAGDGIRIGGAGADRNAIHACYVGTDAVGGSAVSSNGGDGIRATAPVSDLLVSGNVIARNGADGIDVQVASSCAVYHNTVHANGADGIAVAGGAVIRNNVFTGNGGYGIRIASGSPTESDNGVPGASTNPANTLGRSNAALDPSDLDIDPEYGNAAAGDFALNECTSLAINTGLDLGAEQPDVNGAAAGLWNGPAPDMGAFESSCAAQPLQLVKRGFLTDGSPVADGATLPRGTLVDFLLYLNNPGPARLDASVRDVLDPGFAYVAGTTRIDTTSANCSSGLCSGGEEAAIFAAVGAQPASTDVVDGDLVSYDVPTTTIDAGDQNASNGRLDVSENSVAALRIRVRVQ
jgi:hypothetical protein